MSRFSPKGHVRFQIAMMKFRWISCLSVASLLLLKSPTASAQSSAPPDRAMSHPTVLDTDQLQEITVLALEVAGGLTGDTLTLPAGVANTDHTGEVALHRTVPAVGDRALAGGQRPGA